MFILLDIDGVMVSASSWKRPEIMDDGFPKFNFKAINALEKIISKTKASIILTTSHKFKYNILEWESIFNNRGINHVKIEKLNQKINYFNRKQEILDWLKDDSIKNYVIIDDDKSLNSLPIKIRERFIQTSPLVGLNDELANFAIEILLNN